MALIWPDDITNPVRLCHVAIEPKVNQSSNLHKGHQATSQRFFNNLNNFTELQAKELQQWKTSSSYMSKTSSGYKSKISLGYKFSKTFNKLKTKDLKEQSRSQKLLTFFI